MIPAYNINKITVALAVFCVQMSLSSLAGQEETLFIQQFVKSSSLVFDVGAHIGAKTDLYLKLNARVVCIEPQPSCLNHLIKKYQLNPNVHIVGKGLADKIGEMELYICSAAPTISTFSDEWQHGRFENDFKWDKKIIVPVTTLDELIKMFGVPYFCKIDVEGFEPQVLMGLSQTIPYISFEYTKELFKNSKTCLEHLSKLGYVSFNYTIGETPAFIHPEWISSEQLIREIECHSDDLVWGDIYAHYE